jgi:hypothetical protein
MLTNFIQKLFAITTVFHSTCYFLRRALPLYASRPVKLDLKKSKNNLHHISRFRSYREEGTPYVSSKTD